MEIKIWSSNIMSVDFFTWNTQLCKKVSKLMTSKKKTNRDQIVKFLSVLLVQMTLFENDWTMF